MMDEKIRYVRVTNGMDEDFLDRYDGVPVRIAPGKSENLPADMAFHFFHFTTGADHAVMMKHTAKRHGWNTTEYVKVDPITKKSRAEELFDKLKIEAVVYKLVPADEGDPSAPIPADPQLPAAVAQRHSEEAVPRPPRRVQVSV